MYNSQKIKCGYGYTNEEAYQASKYAVIHHYNQEIMKWPGSKQ